MPANPGREVLQVLKYNTTFFAVVLIFNTLHCICLIKLVNMEIHPGIFWGLIFAPGIFWGFKLPFDHSHHLKSRVTPFPLSPSLWVTCNKLKYCLVLNKKWDSFLFQIERSILHMCTIFVSLKHTKFSQGKRKD